MKKARKSYGARLVASLGEAVAIERGEMLPAATSQHVLTARTAGALPAPAYAAAKIRHIRQLLNLSQPVFAQVLNVSPETVRSWEQGKKQPSGPAERLLQIAERHPEWVLSSVHVRS